MNKINLRSVKCMQTVQPNTPTCSAEKKGEKKGMQKLFDKLTLNSIIYSVQSAPCCNKTSEATKMTY